MNEILKINYDNERITLSARELHEALEVKTHFKDWFPRMCEYGFQEGNDFCSFLSKSTGGRPATDYQITLDMAKEIAMIQRSEKGKHVRQYFIEVEKQWNSPERVIARGYLEAKKQLDILNNQIVELKPKALFADAVAASDTSILVGDLAKILKQNGYQIGANRLFKKLREDGYLIKRKGSDWNMPTQKSMELGLLEIKEHTHINSNGCNITTKTPVVTGKGQIYFVNKLLKEGGSNGWTIM